MNSGLALALTLLLVLANGFFVAAEFSLVAARRSVLEPMARRGSRRGATALRAIAQLSSMLAGAQLGITVSSLALGSLSEPAIAHLLEAVFVGLSLPDSLVTAVSFALALGVVTVLHVVIGEMVPKNIALAGPEQAAMWLAPPLAAVVTVAKPVIWLLNRAANLSLRIVGVVPRDDVNSVFTRDQVAQMVADSHRQGLLDADEAELLAGAISFGERTAAGTLLPTSVLRTVGRDVTPDQLEALTVSTGFSRFPLADYAGYLHVKDVVVLTDRGRPVPAELLRPLPEVALDTPLRTVFDTMRRHGSHLVKVVADGSPRGVVALEDVVEQLVGEIRDVHGDRPRG